MLEIKQTRIERHLQMVPSSHRVKSGELKARGEISGAMPVQVIYERISEQVTLPKFGFRNPG